MALFSNKELESIQTENQRLRLELERCREAMAFDRNTIKTLTEAADNFRERLLSFQEEAEKQAAEIADLRRRLAEMEAISHNERGAGRKSKATPEQERYILSLHKSGKGYRAIADILSEATGTAWNKTTVRNVILRQSN